jgi:protein FAM32A
MADPFASVIGGGLKLKGGLGVAGGGVKKRDKPKKAKPAAAAEGDGAADEAPPSQLQAAPDRRTEAERRHDERVAKEEQRLIAKMAAKTHREKVQDFNVYLSKLSEHHDIPRVGPG